MGVPQELGRTCRLLGNIPVGATGSPTPGHGGALVRHGAKTTSGPEVPPSGGNEARRDGRQESERLDSTVETGEQHPVGASGGKRDVESRNRY